MGGFGVSKLWSITVASIGAAALIAAAAAASPATAATITKDPDLGPFYQPLSATNPSGSFVYADSFIAPTNDTVSTIGIWLTNLAGDTSTQPIVFNIYGTSASMPDPTNVVATTGLLTLNVTGALTLFVAPTTTNPTLTAGETYWVVGSEVGLSGGGQLQVGGHTQNTEGINDNGTFWFSNDSTGATFTDTGVPGIEMAFTVNAPTATASEPASLGLLGFAIVGLVFTRRRRAPDGSRTDTTSLMPSH